MADGGEGGGGGGGGRGLMHATLDGHVVVPCFNLITWGRWLEKADRRVCSTMLGRCWVSTVFLGLDHGWGGRALWFETCVFRNGNGGEEGERYATWDEAEAGHARAVQAERVSFDAWVDSVAGLKRVRVIGWDRGIALMENYKPLPTLLVYRNRRRVPFRADTYKRRFGATV